MSVYMQICTSPRAPLQLLPSAILVLLVLLGAVSCGKDKATGSAPAREAKAVGPGVLARVNGVPVTVEDVELAKRRKQGRGVHGGPPTPDRDRRVLATLVRQELMSQRAVQLGLERDPDYQRGLRRLQSQLTDFRRRHLSQLFMRQRLSRETVVSDAEVRAYYSDNAWRIQKEVHVWQILRRSRKAIEQDLAELRRGTPFVEVAAKSIPEGSSGDKKPWDLGFLRWTQVPLPWHAVVYRMTEGGVSDVIQGPNNRFWIVKLIGVRRSPGATLEANRSLIVEVLRSKKREALLERIEQELRKGARIVYGKAR